MKKKTFTVQYQWTVVGSVEIEAKNQKEADEIVDNMLISDLESAEYLEDSFQINNTTEKGKENDQ